MQSPWILIAFHSAEGQTAKIADRLAVTLRRHGAVVDVCDAAAAPAPEWYDAVVLGDSIHAHHHSAALTRYVRRYVQALNSMPTALFQVSLTSTNLDQEHTDAANAMLLGFTDRTGLDPDLIALFAGALAYSKYGWLKRRVMRRIARAEGGGTDTSRDYEYTDWSAVDRFALDVLRIDTIGDRVRDATG